MKHLVTGGAGFIGSNLVDELIASGDEVICLDKNKNGYWNDEAHNHVGDICDSSLVDKLMPGVDYVFHFAADVLIQETIKDPIHCYYNNVVGLATVLTSAKENNVKKFVFSSTSAIYKCDYMIQSEDSHEDPCLNPYASSKKSGEHICEVYSNLYGLDTVVLRYFNVYGNRQHTKGQYAPVLGIFIKQRKENTPLTITGDGSQKRDFVHVKDVVNANILAAKNSISAGNIYNVGSGINYSVQEIADMISPIQAYIDKRPGEVERTLASIDKIKTDLNWKPTVSLEEWLQNELNVIEV